MDPSKTIKIADFDRVVREAKRPSQITRPVIVIGSAAAKSAPEVKGPENEITKPRARVELDPSVMQRMAAEIWAGQTPDPLMPATVRRPPMAPASQPAPPAKQHVISERGQATVKLPRYGNVPSVRALRIACGALCAVCLGIAIMATTGRLESKPVRQLLRTAAKASPAKPPAPPAPAVETTASAARSKPAPVATAPAAVVAEPVAKTLLPAPSAHASSITPRSAVDALIAGKQQLAQSRYRALASSRPDQPAYEAAARILAEMEARSAESF